MARYIYQHPDWPHFFWDQEKLAASLAQIHLRQGRLMGTLSALGFLVQNDTLLNNLTLEVIKSSDIEGEILNPDQVRSSIARRLGLSIENPKQSTGNVEGAVEVLLDATQHFNQDLTEERLCHWQFALLKSDPKSAYLHLNIGKWRDDAHGPMQVISGPIGRERVHFEAPPAEILSAEMATFIQWANQQSDIDPVLKAAIAHLWFVTIHPFDDGNGRIARAITDWLLARHEQSALRFYSMSAQIRQERKTYYAILESTSKGDLEITRYLEWFLDMLNHAFDATEQSIRSSLAKSKFWEKHAQTAFNARQTLMLNKLFDGFIGKLTTTKWAKITKCSQDTALRDINTLIDLGILKKDAAGGRSTGYKLITTPQPADHSPTQP